MAILGNVQYNSHSPLSVSCPQPESPEDLPHHCRQKPAHIGELSLMLQQRKHLTTYRTLAYPQVTCIQPNERELSIRHSCEGDPHLLHFLGLLSILDLLPSCPLAPSHHLSLFFIITRQTNTKKLFLCIQTKTNKQINKYKKN